MAITARGILASGIYNRIRPPLLRRYIAMMPYSQPHSIALSSCLSSCYSYASTSVSCQVLETPLGVAWGVGGRRPVQCEACLDCAEDDIHNGNRLSVGGSGEVDLDGGEERWHVEGECISCPRTGRTGESAWTPISVPLLNGCSFSGG